jgi:hypothetical protein
MSSMGSYLSRMIGDAFDKDYLLPIILVGFILFLIVTS